MSANQEGKWKSTILWTIYRWFWRHNPPKTTHNLPSDPIYIDQISLLSPTSIIFISINLAQRCIIYMDRTQLWEKERRRNGQNNSSTLIIFVACGTMCQYSIHSDRGIIYFLSHTLHVLPPSSLAAWAERRARTTGWGGFSRRDTSASRSGYTEQAETASSRRDGAADTAGLSGGNVWAGTMSPWMAAKEIIPFGTVPSDRRRYVFEAAMNNLENEKVELFSHSIWGPLSVNSS